LENQRSAACLNLNLNERKVMFGDLLRKVGVLQERRWEPHGTGYDDNVRDANSGTIRKRRPGDIPEMDALDAKYKLPSDYVR
jgi:hypothetical protein